MKTSMWANFVFVFASVFLLSCCVNRPAVQTAGATDVLFELSTNSGRRIATRLVSKAECDDCPLVIFSHGANAAYDRYDKFIIPLAEQGFRIAIPNHVDSEEHRDRAAYGPADWMALRLEDYRVIAEHFNAEKLFVAGHSFGALIAQIAAGATLLDNKPEHIILPNQRPLAAIALSPPGAINAVLDASSWQSIKVPTLVTTGTTDIVPRMVERWEQHLEGYEAAPISLSYALVYQHMDHYMNGAYGRESNQNTVARTSAMQHLVQASADFFFAAQEGQAISQRDWKKRSNDGVVAKKR